MHALLLLHSRIHRTSADNIEISFFSLDFQWAVIKLTPQSAVLLNAQHNRCKLLMLALRSGCDS